LARDYYSNSFQTIMLNPEGNEATETIEKKIAMAESSAICLGILGVLIFISGAGFWTVNPPGEKDLCQIEVLGLQNKTTDDQNFALGACHGLYATVFNALHAISMPFLACGALCLVSAYTVGSGAMARDLVQAKGFFRCAICLHLGGLFAVALPSLMFPAAAAAVAAGLAPIHAYFITIMVGHFAVSLSGAAANTSDMDPAVREAAETYETLYLGYCAASRVELCLWIGSSAMVVLFWYYLLDIGRNVWMHCSPPQYENSTKGCQLCLLRPSSGDAAAE